jgi:O-antigen/teichoic acid export membrane protein
MPPDADSSLTPELDERSSRFQLARPAKLLFRLFSGRGAREGYLASIDQAVISLANFLATVILARMVSPTELGVYGVGFTSLRLVRSIQDGLVIQPINTFGSSMDLPHFRRYVTSASIIQLLLALSASILAAIGGWGLTRMGNDIAGPALYSLWFTFLFWQLQEHLRRVLYTRGDVFNAVLNTTLANGIRLGVLVWWAVRGELTGIGGLHAIAWGSLAALIPGLWQTRSYWTTDFANLIETWRKNWDFGRWILGGTLANWVSVEFYPVLTAGMISFAAAGAYRALQNLVAPIHMLLRATDTFLTPRAARLYSTSGRKALIHNLRLTYLMAGIPILCFLSIAILFPIPLLRLLYGETYVPYSSGMVLMAVFYALWYAYWPLQTALKAARLSRPIFIANLAATMAMFTVGIWMIYQFGVYGTIAGQALNALIVGLILWTAWFSISRQERSLD